MPDINISVSCSALAKISGIRSRYNCNVAGKGDANTSGVWKSRFARDFISLPRHFAIVVRHKNSWRASLHHCCTNGHAGWQRLAWVMGTSLNVIPGFLARISLLGWPNPFMLSLAPHTTDTCPKHIHSLNFATSCRLEKKIVITHI